MPGQQPTQSGWSSAHHYGWNSEWKQEGWSNLDPHDEDVATKWNNASEWKSPPWQNNHGSKWTQKRQQDEDDNESNHSNQSNHSNHSHGSFRDDPQARGRGRGMHRTTPGWIERRQRDQAALQQGDVNDDDIDEQNRRRGSSEDDDEGEDQERRGESREEENQLNKDELAVQEEDEDRLEPPQGLPLSASPTEVSTMDDGSCSMDHGTWRMDHGS